jgi:hypothetical protein
MAAHCHAGWSRRRLQALGLALVLVLPGHARAAEVQASPPEPEPSATETPRLPPAETQALVTALTIFAGTPSGLWRTADWGAHWDRVRGKGAGESLDDLGAVHAVSCLGSRVWVAGDGGLRVSLDFGTTWQRRRDGVSLAVLTSRYFEADPTVLLGTPEGLLRSEDGGIRFTATAIREVAAHRMEWPGPALLVATSSGVRKTLDAGRTLIPTDAGLPQSVVRSLAVSSFFQVDPVAFAGFGDGGGLYRSSDGGKSWSTSGLQGRSVNDLYWLGPFLYAATDGGLYRSEDAGRNFNSLSVGLPLGTAATVLLFPLAPDSGNEVFLGTDRGLFHSLDGGSSWQTTGLKDEVVLALATFPPPARPGKRSR